jgi:hypothetical protein
MVGAEIGFLACVPSATRVLRLASTDTSGNAAACAVRLQSSTRSRRRAARGTNSANVHSSQPLF